MLKKPDGERRYTCFGVACELFRQRYPLLLQRNDTTLVAAGYCCGEYISAAGRERFHLPELVFRWLGLADCFGTLHPAFAFLGYDTLGDWEDNEVRSFSELADIIDANGLQVVSDAITT